MAAGTEWNEKNAYLRAAELLGREGMRGTWGCCDVISEAVMGDPVTNCHQRKAFEFLFRPKHSALMYWGELWGEKAREVREVRILALCFMAAIDEAGDA